MEQTEIERARTSIKDYRKGYGQPQLHTDCIIQLMMGHSKRELSQLQAKQKEDIKQALIDFAEWEQTDTAHLNYTPKELVDKYLTPVKE